MLPDHPHCHTLKPGCKGGVCLVGEKPDKELPGIHSRGACVEILSKTEGTVLQDLRG